MGTVWDVQVQGAVSRKAFNESEYPASGRQTHESRIAGLAFVSALWPILPEIMRDHRTRIVLERFTTFSRHFPNLPIMTHLKLALRSLRDWLPIREPGRLAASRLFGSLTVDLIVALHADREGGGAPQNG